MRSPVTGLPTTSTEAFMDRRQIAAHMGVSVGTIDNMVRAGMPSVTWGRRCRRFRASTAVAWAQAQERKEAA